MSKINIMMQQDNNNNHHKNNNNNNNNKSKDQDIYFKWDSHGNAQYLSDKKRSVWLFLYSN